MLEEKFRFFWKLGQVLHLALRHLEIEKLAALLFPLASIINGPPTLFK